MSKHKISFLKEKFVHKTEDDERKRNLSQNKKIVEKSKNLFIDGITVSYKFKFHIFSSISISIYNE